MQASQRPPPRRLFFVTVAVGIGGAILPPAWLLFGHHIENALHRRSFDSAVWKREVLSTRHGDWPPRLCMVDDLLASGRLDGLTEPGVVALLGPPDSKLAGDWYYHLGPERGFIRIDSESLVVGFGEDGKANRSRIYRD
jgi:hypothetical protein